MTLISQAECIKIYLQNSGNSGKTGGFWLKKPSKSVASVAKGCQSVLQNVHTWSRQLRAPGHSDFVRPDVDPRLLPEKWNGATDLYEGGNLVAYEDYLQE